MKRMGLLLLAALSVCSMSFAQGNTSLAVTSGYTMSAFEDQEDAAGTLPLGVQLGYMASPNLQVGAEVNYLLSGLTWKGEYAGFTLEQTFEQTIVSAYAKYFLGQGNVKPFVKGGVGYFMGNAKWVYKYDNEEDTDDMKIDPAIGFIVGAGVTLTPNIFVEFNYNLVSRKYAEDDAADMDPYASANESSDKFGMNTWSILVGYKFNL